MQQKKTVKKCLEKCHLRGEGGGRGEGSDDYWQMTYFSIYCFYIPKWSTFGVQINVQTKLVLRRHCKIRPRIIKASLDNRHLGCQIGLGNVQHDADVK